ncbi:hypothetical protein MASR2M70_05730 [Bacillota bacterium]
MYYYGNGGTSKSGSEVVAHVTTSGSDLEIYDPVGGIQTTTSGSDLDIYDLSGGMYNRTGYEHTGWNTNADGTGVNYTGNDVIKPGGRLQLYAQWGPTPLHAAILEAKEILGEKVGIEIIISSDGVDVSSKLKWTTQNAVTSLQNAVNNAEGIMNNPATTDNEANAALTAIKNAITVFNNSLSPGSLIYADSIALDKEEITIAPGQSILLTATLLPANHTDSLSWMSSNPAVATISGTGIVKGINNGAAVITATTGSGKTATCSVEVISPTIVMNAAANNGEVSITLSASNVIIEDGQAINLVYAVYKNNRMIEIKIKSPSVINGSFTDSETIDYELSKVPDTCKLFIIRNSNMTPMGSNTTRLLE